MNGEIFKFFGEVGLKTEEAEKGLKDITGSAESTGSNLVGIFKKTAIAIGAIFTAGKIIDFGKMAVEAAASAQAIEAQFEQVFGSLQGEANAMIDGMAEEFGMLPNRILPSFTQLTSMFKGVGMEATHAMNVAEQVTTSAADAAAFYDVSMESAQASLTSFIKGNYQAGEAVGVFATDAQLAQFAIEQGVVDSTASWRDLDEATKMATRADYITNMQEMSGATGQAARESEEFENVMGNLRQAWQDFLSVVGGPILNAVIPVIQGITKGIVWLSEAIKPVTENLGEWVDSLDAVKKLSSIFKNVQKWFKDIGKELKGINKDFDLTEMLDGVKDFVKKAKGLIDNFISGVANFFQPVVDGFLRHTEIIRDYAGDMFEVILQLFNGDWSGAWDTFKESTLETLENLLENFSETFEDLKENFKEVWEDIKEWASNVDWTDVGQTIMTAIGNAIRGAVSFAGDIVEVIKKWITNQIGLEDDASWSDIAGKILEKIAAGVKFAAKKITTFMVNFIAELNKQSPSPEEVDGFTGKILTAIWKAVKGLTSAFFTIARAIVKGISEGLEDVDTSEWSPGGRAILEGIKNGLKNIWEFSESVSDLIDAFVIAIETGEWSLVGKAIWDMVVAALRNAVPDSSGLGIIMDWINGGPIYDHRGGTERGGRGGGEGTRQRGGDGGEVNNGGRGGGLFSFLKPLSASAATSSGYASHGGIGSAGARAGASFSLGTPTVDLSALENAVQQVRSLMEKIKSTIAEYEKGVQNQFRTLFLNLNPTFEEAKGTITQSIRSMLEKLKSTIAEYDVGVQNQFKAMFNKLKPVYEQAQTDLVQATRSKLEKLKSTIAEYDNGVANQFKTMFNKLKPVYKQAQDDLVKATRDMFEKYKSTIASYDNGVVNQVRTMMNKMIGAFREGISRAQQAGADTGRGFYNGLAGQAGRIRSLAASIGNSVDRTIRQALDTRSPSKKAERTGTDYMDGLYNGLVGSLNKIKAAISQVTNTMLFNPAIPDVGIYNSAASITTQRNDATLSMMEETNYLLRKLLQKDTDLIINGRVLSEEILDDINELNDIYNNRNIRIQGGSW